MHEPSINADSSRGVPGPFSDAHPTDGGDLPPETLQRLHTIAAVVDASPLVIFLWRFVGGQSWPVDYVSASVRQFGYSPEDFLSGRVTWVGATHPDDVPRLEAEVERHHAQGETEFFQEYRLVTATGTIRWVDDRTFAVRDAAGTITHYAGAIRDITPRKDAQAKLAEQHATLNAIMNSVRSSIYAVDRAYCYTGFNAVHVATMRFHYGAEIKVGGCLLDYMPVHKDQVNARRNFDRVLSGEPFSLECRDDVHGSGHETTLLTFNPIRGEGNAIVGASVVVRDLTLERRAADQVRASEEWFRALIEHAFDLIVVTDSTGVIQFVSANTERLMGYKPEQTLGHAIFEFLHAEDVEPGQDTFETMLRQPGAAILSQFRVRHGDGRWRWTEIAGQNLLQTREVSAIVLNLRDITERLTTEQALRESEERLRVALRTVPIVVSHADRDLRYTWMHNARHGFRVEDIIGRLDSDFLPPETAAYWMDLKRRVLTSGVGEHLQHELAVNGIEATYDTVIEPVRDASGEISGLTIVSFDISVSKRAEEEVRRLNAELERRVSARTAELAESEERYRLLFNAQTHAVIVFDTADWRVVDANEAALALYGHARPAIMRCACRDVFAVPEQADAIIARILAGDCSPALLVWHRRQDGAVIPVEISPYVFRQQGHQMVAMVMRDLSVIAETERLLRESEAKFRVLAEESPNMIFINQGGRLVYVNPRCVSVMGYTRKEMYAPTFDFMSVIETEFVALVRLRFTEHLQGRETEPYEYALRTKEGRRIDAILATRLIDYENGKAIFGIVTDITATREAEHMRIRQQDRLQRLAAKLAVAQDEEQRRIADGLHDDVAQVLTACRYRLASLHEGMTEEAVRETRADLDALLGQAQKTIRSLSFELASSTLHQRELVPAIEALCLGMTRRYDVNFVFRKSGLPVALSAETTVVLFKATRELLFNVVKHAGVDHAVVTVVGERAGLRIQVEDTGRGFPKTKGASESELGRGLGLYQIRERLRDVGGRMRVESRPDVRTRITLTVPQAEE